MGPEIPHVGRLAQGESASFTRKMSRVQILDRPQSLERQMMKNKTLIIVVIASILLTLAFIFLPYIILS